MAGSLGVYSKAVVCGVPESLPAAALRTCDSGEPVNLQKAREQHDQYVKVYRSIRISGPAARGSLISCCQVLRELVPEVHVMPVDERYPDCVFVEDPVIVCDGTALITIPGRKQFNTPLMFSSFFYST